MTKKGLLKWVKEQFMGADDDQPKKTTAQKLQGAVEREINLANAKGEAATAAMVATDNARKELANLVAQYQELQRQALSAEKKGDAAQAQKILALALAIKEKIETGTERYESANNAAKQMISEARKQFKAGYEASQDLPRRVLQIEINQMAEKARNLEGEAKRQIEGKQSYKALANSIDLNTARIMAQNLIAEGTIGLDEEVEQVLKEAQFQDEYKKLQETAKTTEDEIINTEIIEKDDAVSRAAGLLSEPAFGGMIPQLNDGFTIKKEPMPIKANVISDEEGDKEE